MDKDAKVAELIANEATQFGEDDREWLMALPDDQLSKLEPKVVEAPPAAPASTPEPKDNALEVKDGQVQIDGEEYVKKADLDRTVADLFKKNEEQHEKENLVQRLIGNQRNALPETTLRLMDLSGLKTYEQSLNPAVRMAGGAQVKNNEEDDTAPEMPKMDFSNHPLYRKRG